MSCLSKISPDTLVLIGAILSILLTQGMSSNDINILGNFLAEIGAAMSTKAAQIESQEAQENMIKQIDDLEKQLSDLKKQVCR